MNNLITKWEDCQREDLNMIPKMQAAGFYPQFSSQDKKHNRTTVDNIPHDEVTFLKGETKVFQKYTSLRTGVYSVWQSGELENGRYAKNTKQANSLNELLPLL